MHSSLLFQLFAIVAALPQPGQPGYVAPPQTRAGTGAHTPVLGSSPPRLSSGYLSKTVARSEKSVGSMNNEELREMLEKLQTRRASGHTVSHDAAVANSDVVTNN